MKKLIDRKHLSFIYLALSVLIIFGLVSLTFESISQFNSIINVKKEFSGSTPYKKWFLRFIQISFGGFALLGLGATIVSILGLILNSKNSKINAIILLSSFLAALIVYFFAAAAFTFYGESGEFSSANENMFVMYKLLQTMSLQFMMYVSLNLALLIFYVVYKKKHPEQANDVIYIDPQ